MRGVPKTHGRSSFPRKKALAWLAGLFFGILVAYSNHFGNTFHFDDIHTIVDNPALHSLFNIPSFFADAKTFSISPLHQTYRPLITASLAIDYALGQSLEPLWFHVSTFLWFLVQLILMYALYMFVLERTSPNSYNWWLAWLGVGIYGLHPASAETINYIIQRGDLYATVGVVAGVVVYAWKPPLRRFGFYLLPALAGMLAKPSALIFAVILLAYIFLIDRPNAQALLRSCPQKANRGERSKSTLRGARQIEQEACTSDLTEATSDRHGEVVQQLNWLISSVRLSIPAFVLSVAYWYFQKAMTPSTVVYAPGVSALDYWITQPYVTLRYFRSFLFPFYLKFDTDLQAFRSTWSAPALVGFGFCGLLVAVAMFTSWLPKWRSVSFGLWWFLIGILPTAFQPLAEVENDHRMFLPFVGLSLAVVCTGGILARLAEPQVSVRRFAMAGIVILAALAFGTHVRNNVWHTEESLWRDDIEKSPNNPRGHYDLGLALATKSGHMEEAISEYETAIRIFPDYVSAHNNLGNMFLNMGRLPEAVSEFKAALRAEPNAAELHNNLGAALARMPGTLSEAIFEYKAALRIDPDYLLAHYNLGAALSQVPSRVPEAISEYEAVVRIKPDFVDARYYLGILLSTTPGRVPEAVHQLEAVLQIRPDPAGAANSGPVTSISGR